jgi:hypothetical protein
MSDREIERRKREREKESGLITTSYYKRQQTTKET